MPSKLSVSDLIKMKEKLFYDLYYENLLFNKKTEITRLEEKYEEKNGQENKTADMQYARLRIELMNDFVDRITNNYQKKRLSLTDMRNMEEEFKYEFKNLKSKQNKVENYEVSLPTKVEADEEKGIFVKIMGEKPEDNFDGWNFKKYKDAPFSLIQREVEQRMGLLRAAVEQEKNLIIWKAMKNLIALSEQQELSDRLNLIGSGSKDKMIFFLEQYDNLVRMQKVCAEVISYKQDSDNLKLSQMYVTKDEKNTDDKLSKVEAIYIAAKLQAELDRLNAKYGEIAFATSDPKLMIVSARIGNIRSTMNTILNSANSFNFADVRSELEKLEKQMTKVSSLSLFKAEGASEISKIKDEVKAWETLKAKKAKEAGKITVRRID